MVPKRSWCGVLRCHWNTSGRGSFKRAAIKESFLLCLTPGRPFSRQVGLIVLMKKTLQSACPQYLLPVHEQSIAASSLSTPTPRPAVDLNEASFVGPPGRGVALFHHNFLEPGICLKQGNIPILRQWPDCYASMYRIFLCCIETLHHGRHLLCLFSGIWLQEMVISRQLGPIMRPATWL